VYRRRKMSSGDWRVAYQQVVSALAGAQHASKDPNIPLPLPVTGGDPEPQPTRHLRSYTSFLAPELGASVDTSTLGAIVLRNLLVNWLMLLPLLLAVTTGLRAVGQFLLFLQNANASADRVNTFGWWDGLILGGFVVAAGIAAFALPSHDSTRQDSVPPPEDGAAEQARKKPPAMHRLGGWRTYGGWLFAGIVAFGSVMLAVTRSTQANTEFSLEFAMATVVFAIMAGSIAVAECHRIHAADKALKDMVQKMGGPVERHLPQRVREAGIWVGALLTAVLCALITAALLLALRDHLYQPMLDHGHFHLGQIMIAHSWLFVVLGIPSVVTVLLMTTTLLCALLGVFERDEDREWWARCGGVLIGFGVCWMAAQTLVYFTQPVGHALYALVSGLVISGFSSFLGFSGQTGADSSAAKKADLGKMGQFLSRHNLLLPALALVGVVLIGIGVVALGDWLRGELVPAMQAHHPLSSFGKYWPHGLHWMIPGVLRSSVFSLGKDCATLVRNYPDGGAALLLCVAAGVLAVLLNLAININLFSLFGIYRMRLMRAYLGASNVFRRPDPFTNFDPRDTPRMFQMPCEPGVPMHLINCTLNLTGTTNAAWRQRKAESFGFSPVACGGWRVGYARTTEYAGRHNGPDLAAAMSISGAAFNPNMGYHSSPLLSVLMTFFDVRLGAWLPNPKWPAIKRWIAQDNQKRIEHFIGRPGPLFALWPLVQELLGLADDNRAWVELTDGGHFENLGIYEMVLRRTKHIVVVDAGADGDYQFEDLGNAIRKIQIDLGVPIKFDGAMPMKTRMDAGNLYCAVGTIDYGCVDQEPGCPSEQYAGKLVYIKAVLTGNEPADIFQYAKTHTTFPNETTANQFFNESQFESYRHLGSFALDSIVDADLMQKEPKSKPADYGSLASFFTLAQAVGRPATAAPVKSGTLEKCPVP